MAYFIKKENMKKRVEKYSALNQNLKMAKRNTSLSVTKVVFLEETPDVFCFPSIEIPIGDHSG